MDIDLIIGGALLAAALFTLFLKTNINMAIMGLCAGYVFSDLLSDEVVELLFENTKNLPVIQIVSGVSIALILLPALLILIRFKGHQKGRILFHLVPAVGFALLAAMLIFKDLPVEIIRELGEKSVIYAQFESFEVFIAAAVVSIAVVDVVIHDGSKDKKLKKAEKG